MPLKNRNRIRLNAGEIYRIEIEGSSELAFTISIPNTTDLQREVDISGPTNANSRTFKVTAAGWREIPPERESDRLPHCL
jgi:hypothetical protein